MSGRYGTPWHEAHLVAWEREHGDGYPEPPSMASLGGDTTYDPEPEGAEGDDYRCLGCGEVLAPGAPFETIFGEVNYAVHPGCVERAMKAPEF